MDTSKTWPSKTTKRVKESVLEAAAGVRGGGASGSVVEMEDDGKSNRPGPAFKSYETARSQASGAHLLFNAFWLVSSFCIYQMYMRDSLHQIDHGITIHVLRGILRLFYGEYNVFCSNKN